MRTTCHYKGRKSVYEYDYVQFHLRRDQEPFRSALAEAEQLGLRPPEYVRWLMELRFAKPTLKNKKK